MNKTVAGEENLYLELESRQATGAGIYEGIPGDGEDPAITTEKTSERQGAATKLREPTEPALSGNSDAVIVRRLLCIMTAVVVLSFLTAATTLTLAITMMTFRNSPTDCASVQDFHSTNAMKSDYRCVRVTENITPLENKLEKKVQYLTDRLESSQLELKTLKSLFDGQLKDLWMVVNVTSKKTSNLANKLPVMDGVWVNMSATHEAFEKKLDTRFKLLIASTKALNKSDGELTSSINELRQNQILTKRGNERLALNVTQLESDVQELKKASGNVSSRAGNLERGFAQMNSLTKTLQAVNAAQNASHEDLESLYKRLNHSLATVNATLNDKLPVMDGVWVNMSATHEAFEKKLDTRFKLLIASTKALNKSDGELTSSINELRQNQTLTKRANERLALNVTQLESGVQELKKASGNVSSRAGNLERGFTQMNSLTKTLQAVNAAQNASHEDLESLYKRLNHSLATVNATLNDKINNISKMTGPIGPPGFNGSQGPAGPAGSIGAPGPKGAGNFSACKYHEKIATTSGGDSDAYVDAPSGYIIMAATCSTNYALECNLATVVMPGTKTRRYICNCKGTSFNFLGNPKRCFLHYWLCPIS